MSLLTETVAAIMPASVGAMAAAEERQSMLTKPRDSLGALEDLGTRLCGMYAECPPPPPEPVAIAVFAGDHGVHAPGVSAAPGLIGRKIAAGTADMTRGPAMTTLQVQAAIEVGIGVANDLVAQGNRLLVTGDMGIANTTPSAALISVFTGMTVGDVTGRGTGIDDAMLQHKVSVIETAIRVNQPSGGAPVEALAGVGGFEHAGVVGFLLGAAALHTPVILDVVIAARILRDVATFDSAGVTDKE